EAGEGEPDVGPSTPVPAESGAPGERTGVPDHELITALAVALRDPEEAVRGRARAALERIRPDVLTEWAARELAEGSAEEAVSAAALVELLDVPAPARALFHRACALPPEARGPYLGARRPRPGRPGDGHRGAPPLPHRRAGDAAPVRAPRRR